MGRRTYREPYAWVGGISRAEMAATLRAASRGAARDGNAERARELRVHADRARSTITPRIPERAVSWPREARGERTIWSLAKSAARARRDASRHRRRERRERVAHTKALKLGARTLLAMTCYGCGRFLPGDNFKRHIRNTRDKVEYVDRRCVNCKWGARAKASERTE